MVVYDDDFIIIIVYLFFAVYSYHCIACKMVWECVREKKRHLYDESLIIVHKKTTIRHKILTIEW